MQARQKAEVSSTDAEDKLKAFVSSAAPRSGEGRRGSKGGQEDQAKAMADLDSSLMQRLDEDSATSHKLMESLKATQVGACVCPAWLQCKIACYLALQPCRLRCCHALCKCRHWIACIPLLHSWVPLKNTQRGFCDCMGNVVSCRCLASYVKKARCMRL